MVCKEEIIPWFKDLDSYKRIDVMYQLLNMCLPFELRFLGSCVEELGKHTFHELRGPTLIANDLEKLSKDVSLNQGILEETVRHRVLIYLSLLSSRNYSVASLFYRKLLRTEAIEEYVVKDHGKDEMLNSEFLLLYTMALYHPAFTFEHKQFFSRIVMGLGDSRENRVSTKHIALGYPPGFGYPTPKGFDPQKVPVKSATTSTTGETPTTFHQPPGLPPVPPVPYLDYLVPMWSRPGLPFGPPEVAQFPTNVSPLVSRTASPCQSRSTSPHRTNTTASGGLPPPIPLARIQQQPPPPMMQQPPPPPPPPLNGPPLPAPVAPAVMNGPLPPPPSAQVDILQAIPPPPQQHQQMHLEQLSQITSLQQPLPPTGFAQLADAKVSENGDPLKITTLDDKHLREMFWPPPPPGSRMNPDIKPNGIRFPPNLLGKPRPYLVEQMQALSIDGENSLHHSNSSSNSSPAETPPGTPSSNNTPASTPHGPGRGDNNNKSSRLNGMPMPFQGTPLIQDTTSPPPPPFSSNSVPYNSFPQPFAAAAAMQQQHHPSNRSMFHYNQTTYRPPTFTAHYPSFQTESFPTYSYPYPPLIYSSPFQHPRTPPGCYNCGSHSHVGSECTSQNVEEITQKKTYQLEYDSDK